MTTDIELILIAGDITRLVSKASTYRVLARELPLGAFERGVLEYEARVTDASIAALCHTLRAMCQAGMSTG